MKSLRSVNVYNICGEAENTVNGMGSVPTLQRMPWWEEGNVEGRGRVRRECGLKTPTLAWNTA